MDVPAGIRVVAPVVPGVRRVPAAALLARIDVAGTPLVVTTDDEVAFGAQKMKCEDVIAIRYGVY